MPMYDLNNSFTRLVGDNEDVTRTFNGLEVSEGNAPATKYLIDPRVHRKFRYKFNVNQYDWVCIPKGLIVAFATNGDYELYESDSDKIAPRSGINGHWFKEFESGKYYHGLTIANGGVDVPNEIDQRAVDQYGVPSTYTRTANIAVGVLAKNAYYKIDDRMYGSTAQFITRSLIEVPYVPNKELADLTHWGCAHAGLGATDFLRPGDYVMSDNVGHFRKWNPGVLTSISYIPGNPTFVPAVAASAEAAIAAANTGLNANDTVVIGTVTFTAIAADGTPTTPTATTCQFNIGATAAETANNLMVAINTHSVTSDLVIATIKQDANTTLVIRAKEAGTPGNSIVITGGDRCTVTYGGEATATLAGGTNASFASNASHVSTVPVYVGRDDVRQIVGQVIEVAGQLQPEGWLRWVMWNLDMELPQFAKMLGLKATDIDVNNMYPILDKYINQMKYAKDLGSGIEGLTDGSNIITNIVDELLVNVPGTSFSISKNAKAGDVYFFHLRKGPVVRGSVMIGAKRMAASPVLSDAPAPPGGVISFAGTPTLRITRVDIDSNEFYPGVSNLVRVDVLADGDETNDINLYANYSATGQVPGVPTLWDVRGSIGGVKILLGGLR